MSIRRLNVDTVAGLLAFLVPLGVYVASLAPGVGFWDTGEMQAVPYIFGIAHQTGFPIFVIMGWLVSHLVPFGTVAWRISLMSAVAMAIAAAMVYVALRQFEVPATVAVSASWVFALVEVVWSRGSRAEVLAFAAMFAAIGFVAAIIWNRTGDRRALFVLCASIGLGVANHLIELMLIPGFVVVIFSRFRQLNLRDVLIGFGLALAPLLTYLYLPLRGAYVLSHKIDPTLALGLPPGLPFWDYGDPSSLAKLWNNYLYPRQGDVGSGLSAMLSPEHVLPALAQYSATLLTQFGPFVLALAALGLVLCLQDRPLVTASLALSACLPVIFVLNYDESDAERYFLPSLWLVAVFAGVGAYALAGLIVTPERRRLANAVTTLALIAVAASLWAQNQGLFGQRDDQGAESFLTQMRSETPDNAIIVANWLTAPVMGYASYVEHSFGHRTVVTGWPTDYQDYYPRWLQTRPIYIRAESPFTLSEKGLTATLVDRVSELYRVDHTVAPPRQQVGAHQPANAISPISR